MTALPDFATVTDVAGDEVTQEQLVRVQARYSWALPYCRDRDVIEVACGTGAGLGLLAGSARSLLAGDLTPSLVQRARAHYGNRVDVREFDAATIPVADRSADVVILFEAIYYLPDVERFLTEARRVLRPGGTLLLSSANKDLYDFNPSPFSTRYFGVVELAQLLSRFGFSSSFFGNSALSAISWKQRVLRPIKRFAVAAGLIPKTMAGKRWLKRIVFGGMLTMPPELSSAQVQAAGALEAVPLPSDRPCTEFKIFFCAASNS
jgi:SAM-dependent methyltransferase